MESIRTKKLGLVLAGGGALGAYQFGCLLAIKEAGITFHAVAGTSVGALNAALWSFDRMDEGETLWNSITYEKVYPPKSKLFRNLPPRIYHVLLMLQVVLSLLAGTLKRKPFMPDLEQTRVYFALFNSSAFALGIALIAKLGLDVQVFSLTMLSVVLTTFLYSLILQNTSGGESTGMVVFYSGLLVLGGFIQLVIADDIGNTALAVFGMYAIGSFIYSADSIAFLDSSPLGRTVSEIIGSNGARQSTYVTSAVCRDIFDPKTCRFDRQIPSIGPMGVDLSKAPAPYRPKTEKHWIPQFTDLKELSTIDQVSESLLASAALPFGIVDPVLQENEKLVDGGVVANEPIHPILQHEVDEIWLIHVRPTDTEEIKEELSASIARSSRNSLLAALEIPSEVNCVRSDLHAEIEKDEKYAAFQSVPDLDVLRPDLANLKVLAPTGDLGSFLNGVLKFEGAYCEQLIAEGKRDAETFIAEISAKDLRCCG